MRLWDENGNQRNAFTNMANFGLLPKRNQGKFSKIGRLLGRTSKVWKCRIYLSNYRLIVWIDSVTILVFVYTKTAWKNHELYCRNPFNESYFCFSRCNKIFIYRFFFTYNGSIFFLFFELVIGINVLSFCYLNCLINLGRPRIVFFRVKKLCVMSSMLSHRLMVYSRTNCRWFKH